MHGHNARKDVRHIALRFTGCLEPRAQKFAPRNILGARQQRR
jgi:hypothetical protein